MPKPQWLNALNPHSKEKEKKSDKRFFAAIQAAFLEFLFFEFCKMEDIKEFVRKYILGQEREQGGPDVDFKITQVMEKEPDAANKSWVDEFKSIINTFTQEVAQAAQAAIQQAGIIVNQVIPQQNNPQLNQQAHNAVQHMFQPANAVPQAHHILIAFHAGEHNLQQFSAPCPKFMHDHVKNHYEELQDAFDRYNAQEGLPHERADFENVLQKAMQLSLAMNYSQSVQQNVHEDDHHHFGKLYNQLGNQGVTHTFSANFASAGVAMVSATNALSHDQGLAAQTPFNLNPFDPTPRPK